MYEEMTRNMSPLATNEHSLSLSESWEIVSSDLLSIQVEKTDIVGQLEILRKNEKLHLLLSSSDLTTQMYSKGLTLRISLYDVYAISCSKSASHNNSTLYDIVIHAMSYPHSIGYLQYRKTNKDGLPLRRHVIHRFVACDSEINNVENFVYLVKKMLSYSTPESIAPTSSIYMERGTRKILVFVNPVSGRGKGHRIYRKSILPMFEIAELEVNEILTTHRGHAANFLSDRPLEELLGYAAILAVSGDGLFHEIINGIYRRPDASKLTSQVSLGVIPAGSGNALAESLNVNHPQIAAWNIIKGHTEQMDIMSISFKDQVLYSFLFIAFGLIADVDILSESLRWAGDIRFSLAGIYRLAVHRSYRALLCFPESPESTNKNEEKKEKDSDNEGEDMESQYTDVSDHTRFMDCQSMANEALESPLHFEKREDGSVYFPVPSTWRSLETQFDYFMALNLPSISAGTLVAPLANFQDGLIDLQYIERASLYQLLKGVFAFDKGKHVDLAYVKYRHVNALYLEPKDVDTHIVLDIDGESFAFDQPVLLQSHRNALRVLCPIGHKWPAIHP